MVEEKIRADGVFGAQRHGGESVLVAGCFSGVPSGLASFLGLTFGWREVPGR